MILTCPDCSTRYSIKDNAIGSNGRTVRCSNCSATWFVASEPDTLALINDANEDIAPFHEPDDAAETPTETPPKFARTKPVMGAHVHVRDKAERERRNRRLFGVSMIWGITLTLLACAAIAGYVFRQDIVDKNPAMATVYKALKVPVKLAGLDFEDPGTSHTMIDGKPVLVINGAVINRSNKVQDLPMVELSFVNKSGDIITSWLVELESPKIDPKERVTYIAQYPNPPLDASDLKYKFVTENTLSDTADGG